MARTKTSPNPNQALPSAEHNKPVKETVPESIDRSDPLSTSCNSKMARFISDIFAMSENVLTPEEVLARNTLPERDSALAREVRMGSRSRFVRN